MIRQAIRPISGPYGVMAAVSDELEGVTVATKIAPSVDGDTIGRLLEQLREERTTETYLRAARVCSERGDKEGMLRALTGAARHLASKL